MNNPYETPKARINPDKLEEGKRIGWKLYFFLILLIQLYSWYTTSQEIFNGSYSFTDLVDIFFYPLVILGLFGFAFKRRFFNRTFWKTVFICTVVIEAILVYDLFVSVDVPAEYYTVFLVTTLIIMTPLTYFELLGLYLYAFSNREPWPKTP